jgi:hypothetical protein
MDIEKFKKHLDEWIESPSGKAYIEKERKEYELKIQRYNSFTDWLKTNSFDNLLYRLIIKHDEEYRAKCYENGYEPYPNHVLQFIIDYAFTFGKKVNKKIIKKNKLDSDFPYDITEFEGFYFQIIYGQGSIVRIYNRDDTRLLLQI